MSSFLKVKRSAGTPVTLAVHRILSAANAARARADWPAAARGYARALEEDPDLAHIWIQLGHAHKEGGDLDAAEAAYRRAERLRPADADPHLHLGHLAKLRGDKAQATRFYLAAADLAPDDPRVVHELGDLAVRPAAPDPFLAEVLAQLRQGPEAWSPRPLAEATQAALKAVGDLATALGRTGADAQTLARAASAADLLGEISRLTRIGDRDHATATTVVFDIADLLAYFRNARAPTGIQRVQMEIIAAALRLEGPSVRICCFLDRRDEWIEIPPGLFLKLRALSLSESDPDEWRAAVGRALRLLDAAPPLAFPRGAFLVNLGTSWWQQNYFLFVRRMQQEHGVRYVPFVHDMIPLVRGEYCPRSLREEFIPWAVGLFEHADFFFANSQSTRRDLIKVGAFLGHEIAPERVQVVTLDADNRGGVDEARPVPLRRWGLQGTPYVLIVSTIEPRKNHLRVFEAWTALLKRHGPRRTPRLVCVGHPGWMNESVHQRLAADDGLRDQVTMISLVSDAELAALYRGCLFTVYPSHYEGWGLPVTESLGHGKTPLVADNSSLPEAGGQFARYFDADSAGDLVAALEALIFDPEARRAHERLIAEQFRPRRWEDLARQMADALAVRAQELPADLPVPVAVVGAYHPLRRNRRLEFWPGLRACESYRAGVNWWGPDDWGCWTKAGGAALRLAVTEPGPLRLYLRLQGLPSAACPYRILCRDLEIEGRLAANEAKWITLQLEAPAEGLGVLDIDIQGLAREDLSVVTNNGDPREISIGVMGFYLCRADDPAARAAFLEAAALGALDEIDVNRPPARHIPLE